MIRATTGWKKAVLLREGIHGGVLWKGPRRGPCGYVVLGCVYFLKKKGLEPLCHRRSGNGREIPETCCMFKPRELPRGKKMISKKDT